MSSTDLAAGAPATCARAEAVSCAHCGQPVRGRVERLPAFCCGGCETVFSLLHQEGLQGFYKRLGTEDRRAPVASGKSYTELDDPELLAKEAKKAPGGLLSLELFVEGVRCSACLWLIERTPRLIPGLVEARLDLGRALVRLRWDPEQVALSAIAQKLDLLGYQLHPSLGQERRELERREDRRHLIRLAVAGAAFGNVMLMAFALYGGLFSGIEAEYEQLFRWSSFLVASPAVLYSGAPFWRGALASLRARSPHLDLPIAIGVAVGYVSGAINILLGRGEIYFDSLTALIFLLLVGRWLERRQRRSAADAAELLYALAPSSARIVEGDSAREVPISSVARGMEVEVRAGEHVPVDGVILRGHSFIDASLLTGESRPMAVEPGARVHAGTINQSEVLRISAEETGRATRVGRLMALVEEASQRRAPMVILAQRVSIYFVPAVLALALLTALAWWPVSGAAGLGHAIALLVVTCPCALAMATPLAVTAAVGRAARLGILVKGGDVLERVAGEGLILFDKTGTLTEGRQRVIEWVGDRQILAAAAAIEASSAHPVARALCEAAKDLVVPVATCVVQKLGAGISGSVGQRRISIGAPSWVMESLNAPPPRWAEDARGRFGQAALSTLWIAEEGELVAAVGIGDALRSDARESLHALVGAGYRVGILSGDDPVVVARVAESLGVPAELAHGGRSPEEKLAFVEAKKREGAVLMVGDGVNDAAALSAATVGIAVHGGAEVSLQAADVFLSESGLRAIGDLIAGARRTVRVIQRGVGFSLLYNLVAVLLAMGGRLDPLVAAVLMPLSSLTVVTHAFRSHTFGAR